MKTVLPLLLLLLAVSLSGCELAGDIFEAGIWSGIIIVVLIVAVVIWLIRRVIGRR